MEFELVEEPPCADREDGDGAITSDSPPLNCRPNDPDAMDQAICIPEQEDG